MHCTVCPKDPFLGPTVQPCSRAARISHTRFIYLFIFNARYIPPTSGKKVSQLKSLTLKLLLDTSFC